MSSPVSSSASIPVTTLEDRVVGSILGSFIGDALALGCHWHYNLSQLQERYGRVTDYVDPWPGHYHHGAAKAGDWSQTSQFGLILGESIIEKGGLDLTDFGKRLDQLFETLDGTPNTGVAGWSDGQVRDLWASRKTAKLPWFHSELASWQETSEAAQRSVPIAARYALDRSLLAEAAYQNARFTYRDPLLISQSAFFTVLTGGLISGKYTLNNIYSLGEYVSPLVSPLRSKGFHRTPQDSKRFDKKSEVFLGVPLSQVAQFNDSAIGFPDAVYSPLSLFQAVKDGARIEPPHMASSIFGLPCGVGAVLNGAYYISAVHWNDFRAGVETAVNGGGQNVARAAAVGALLGAENGVQGIPKKWIDGLKHSDKIIQMAKSIAKLVK